MKATAVKDAFDNYFQFVYEGEQVSQKARNHEELVFLAGITCCLDLLKEASPDAIALATIMRTHQLERSESTPGATR